jgi:hypothetical protein
LYKNRVTSKDLSLVAFRYDLDSDFAARLPQIYIFTLPVAVGDCHQALGEYSKALGQYTLSSTYAYINVAIEVPALWIKVAQNYIAWGNDQYKQGDVQGALDTYLKLITPTDHAPNSLLYQGVFASYGNKVKNPIATITKPETSNQNPLTISIVLDARTKLRMINAGLDFWGFSVNHFPIFKSTTSRASPPTSRSRPSRPSGSSSTSQHAVRTNS